MFTNKTFVLTGASGGIGSEITKSLAEQGATLVLIGLNRNELDQLNQSIGGQHHIIEADISTTEGRDTIFQYCQQLNQGIDTLINNAGIGQFSLFQDMDDDHIAAIININLTSTILLSQKLLPILLSRPESHIINIGSILGSIGFPGSSVYCASKFGIRGFTEALRRELADTAVSVSYFAPRATNTAINNESVIAMNRELGTQMDNPEQVAKQFIRFINSSQSHYYLGWPEKLFVRINSVLPSIVDKSILKQLPIIKRYL
ncbi:MAG: short chain dehydrogenase [Methylophaga sp.]|nr:MAG: short chain dehydrogenase [Methylophaga sp.]